MTLLMTIAGLALFAVAAIALWRAVQTPSFVAGLSALILSRLLRSPLKALAPRDFTAAQRQAIREGRNPFDDRPHGGHNLASERTGRVSGQAGGHKRWSNLCF